MAEDTKAKIAHELYETVRKLGGSSDLLSIIGCYGDTLNDDDVLARLREWNVAHEVSRHADRTQSKPSPHENL
ncbi:hypothetical protein ABMA59_36580 [Mesorhizobium sp. CN2-181]